VTHSERTSLFKRHFAEGFQFLQSDNHEAAAKAFIEASRVHPEQWCNTALDIAKQGHPDTALACLEQILAEPAPVNVHAGAWCAVGNVYAGLGKNEESYACFTRSWEMHRSPDSAANRALIHLWRGEMTDAERWVKWSLDLNPWQSDAQFIQASISLMRGNFLTGFRQYECRWRSKNNGLQKIPAWVPEWDPDDDASRKRILIYGEQGSGDTILMLRYASLLRARGLWQCWVVQKGLKPLVESLGTVDQIIYPGDELPDMDCHLPAASLPRAFRTSMETIPPAPYIPRPTPHNFGPGFHIGIAWRGSGANGNDKFRSTSLERWRPVLDVPGVTFHSLQVDHAHEALAFPEVSVIIPTDWLDTAHYLAGLDLVISVDTSLVHLAGAMGVPCWCALHCRPYFVYPITREDCPWYPSVKLFKQKREFEWAPVFERIAYELVKLVVP